MSKLTQEQSDVVSTDENIVVKALAGTGKTHSLYHYIKSRPVNTRILYIAFNKSVQQEAEHRFQDISHVFLDVRTAHSMAYQAVVKKNGYKTSELKPEKVMEILELEDFTMGIHIVNLVNFFCTCGSSKVQDVDYRNTINSPEVLEFVDLYYSEIELGARKILAKMDKGEMNITHDFYLKKWQLSKPKLRYDYILFDEGQDASEVMLDVFNNGSGTKVIVGDSHQQIYGWRNAVNSLEKVNYREFKLTQSFRFDSGIADLAMRVIGWKVSLLKQMDLVDFKIIGSGTAGEVKTRAVIARTNLQLIIQAINDMVRDTVKRPYFEGGFSGYSINAMFNIIKDLLDILKGKKSVRKTPALKNVENEVELHSYIKQSGDILIEQALELVKIYKDDLIDHINELKNKVLDIDEKEKADLIYTTVHKSKGMEYDDVTILSDFKSKKQLANMIKRCKPEFLESMRKYVNEEINL